MNEILKKKIHDLGPWFHNIEINGLFTREISPAPGPQSINHPQNRWNNVKDFLTNIPLKNENILDLGSADGFFSIELAKKGAHVTAVDSWKKMIERINFLNEVLKLNIKTHIQTAEKFTSEIEFRIILNLGLLYHSKHPFLLIENVSKLKKVKNQTMLVESVIADGELPLMYFKPPGGSRHIPKWFPTKSCIIEMLKFYGWSCEVLPYSIKNRCLIAAYR